MCIRDSYKITGYTTFFPPQVFRYPSEVETEETEDGLKLHLPSGGERGDQPTLALYGPYLALYTGRYRATFHISPPAGGVARIRVAVVADGGRKLLQELDMGLASGGTLPVEFWTDGDPDIEFRVYAYQSDLVFEGVELYQLERGTYGG